ncbi:oligopeptide transport system ATP-binding protein [Stella humosa]|uniref:Oligopeptide transport system ATP-binding protein n=1 Tax=Stella humosa TaxID=94 RepID=A0A3N1KN19_9PROT|nr:ABC transporter ATP-binding protein [Stella humosa]ROP83113.1 oligopeptide transport system ATP-binding protein [Stella humosa]BBK30110.1 ABC transporter ATP-binding protein [Stella humosa]
MSGNSKAGGADQPLLQVRDLTVEFRGQTGRVAAVNGVSFDVRPGETLALVGESGSGKSVTSLAIMRLIGRGGGNKVGGSILLRRRDGSTVDLLAVDDATIRDIRGTEIAMVFQEPMTSLNPVHTIGAQVAEGIIFHRRVSKKAALDEAVELLDLVGIPEPRRRLASFPHQLSGGMRQRAMIAVALACKPSLLIADEPTTALDVTIQAQILELMQHLQRQTGMSIVFITHNLGVVAEVADRVLVMYAGRIVEQAPVVPIFGRPLMPYTQGLLRSVPRLDMVGGVHEELHAIPGNVPDPTAMPAGCAFHPRCAHFQPSLCDTAVPALELAEPEHSVRCARWRDVSQAVPA